MDATLFQILELVVKALVIVFAAYILPAIKKYLDDKNLSSYIAEAVRAAEILFPGTKTGSEKLDYVTDLAIQFCQARGINFTDAQLRSLIESFVYGLKKEQ